MNGRRWLRALGLVLFIGFGAGVAFYLLGRAGTEILPSGAKYTMEADVQSSLSLASAADVREAGVLVGRVQGLKREGTITALQLSIDKQYAPIYKNATVLIRAKSIADEDYVQLYPGTPSAGQIPQNGVLPVKQEMQSVQDDDVFSILEKPERASVQKTVKGLGDGLQGSGGKNLNSTLESMTSLVDQGQGFAQILNEEKSQTADLIHSFDGVASALGDRASDIQEMTKAALTTSQAVSARNADLRSTLQALPGFLSSAQTTANRLGTFSTTATPVFSNLRIAFTKLIPAVDNLKPAAEEADTTLNTLDTFATTALPTFEKLTPFAKTTAAFLKPYSKFLQQLSPLSKYLNPYSKEVGSWFANAGAAVNASDSISKLARIILPVSRSDFPTVIPKSLTTVLEKITSTPDTRGSNAYPDPGNAATPQPLSKVIPALDADSAYNAKAPKPLRNPKSKQN